MELVLVTKTYIVEAGVIRNLNHYLLQNNRPQNNTQAIGSLSLFAKNYLPLQLVPTINELRYGWIEFFREEIIFRRRIDCK
jgi:hypothetical protein